MQSAKHINQKAFVVSRKFRLFHFDDDDNEEEDNKNFELFP